MIQFFFQKYKGDQGMEWKFPFIFFLFYFCCLPFEALSEIAIAVNHK